MTPAEKSPSEAEATVPRGVYEALLGQLQEATYALAAMDAKLASAEEVQKMLEAALSQSREETAKATEQANALIVRLRREEQARLRAEAREDHAERLLDTAQANEKRSQTDRTNLQKEVAEKTKQNQLILDRVATRERQIAGLQRKIGRLEEHLDAANASVVRNFDAYVQAEQGRQALAANLPAPQRAAYTGLIGMGACILGG